MTVQKIVHRTSLPTLNLCLQCKWCLKSHTSNWLRFPQVHGLCPNMDNDQWVWHHWLWGQQRWRGSEKGELNDKDKGCIDLTCIILCALHHGIAGACSCQWQTTSFSLATCRGWEEEVLRRIQLQCVWLPLAYQIKISFSKDVFRFFFTCAFPW